MNLSSYDYLTAAGIGLGIYLIIFIIFRARSNSNGRKRNLSFGSYCMIESSFPPKSSVIPPIINILLTFECCPSLENVLQCAESFVKFDRFRSKVVFDRKSNGWVLTHVDIDVKDHVQSSDVGSEQELLNEAQNISNSLLDKNYTESPAWMIHRITNTGKGVSAVLFRFHHTIGDGISLVSVMENVFKDSKGNPLKLTLPERKNVPKQTSFDFSIPFQFILSFFHVISLGLSSYDTNIIFTSPNKSNLTMSKSPKVVLFPTIKLSYLKAIKAKASVVTINDILLSVTTGVIRRYCEFKKDPIIYSTSIQMRALLPVAFPRKTSSSSADDTDSLRNDWVFISASLPLSSRSASRRLEKCYDEMNKIKKSPSAYIQKFLQNNILAHAPKFIQQQALQDIMSRHSMVFSNVPGASEPAYFAGEYMMGIQCIFPNLVNQCLILSYNEKVFMNMVIDGERILDSEVLSQMFVDELKELGTSLKVENCNDSDILVPITEGGVFSE
eukprot:gene3632-7238_t